jgi:maltose-binding protein MalE
VDLFQGSHNRQSTLTPAESEYNTATTTALENVATKKMTPAQALAYIDAQANKALPKSGG